LNKTKFILALDFIADAHTHSTLDTEVHVVPDEVRFIVNVEIPRFPWERQNRHFVFMDQVLELAVSACIATRTKQRV
jgi:hypothetical protein